MLGKHIIELLQGHENKSVMVRVNGLEFSPDFTHHEIDKVKVELLSLESTQTGRLWPPTSAL